MHDKFGQRGLSLALALISMVPGCGSEKADPKTPPDETMHGEVPTLGGCPVFTADDAWNTPIDQAEVNADYTARLKRYLAKAADKPSLHADFGAKFEGKPFGVPFNVVPKSQPLAPVSFEYADESDPGPYPFPLPGQVLIEGGDPRSEDGNRYILTVQQGTCRLFEAWGCAYDAQWKCGLGATFDLKQNSYGQRDKGIASATASGLPVLAGLVRYDEVAAGAIYHALRFGLKCAGDTFTEPASNRGLPGKCTGAAADLMPMGVRVRLAASYDTSSLRGAAKVVAVALQNYGMIFAFNGSDLYVEGEPDARWNDDELGSLKDIPTTALEVVEPVSPES